MSKAIKHFDGEELIFFSFRYFCGRMTISTCDFAERLARAWPDLDERTQRLIRREMEELFKRDDEVREEREGSVRPLGMDCDRAAWQKVRDAYNKEGLA